MHPYLAYWAAALVAKLPSGGLWGRFVRWALWGEHAEPSYYWEIDPARSAGATADERLVWLKIVEADVDASKKERDGKS